MKPRHELSHMPTCPSQHSPVLAVATAHVATGEIGSLPARQVGVSIIASTSAAEQQQKIMQAAA